MSTEPAGQLRERVLRNFSILIGSEPIVAIRQRGRDPETARYTFSLADGRAIRVGTMKVLGSQAELRRVMAVATGHYMPDIARRDWHDAMRRLMAHGIDVDETMGETFTDAVREWIKSYAGEASGDREGAVKRTDPFVADEQLWIHVDGLSKYIRNHYGEQVRKSELWAAFDDLGFTQRNVSFNNKRGKRTSRSYYVIDLADLEAEDE